MIFVSVGTHPHSFARLLKSIATLVDEKKIKGEMRVQAGYTPFSHPSMDVVEFMDIPAFEKTIREADVFITHAGEGNIGTALRLGTPMIIVPRHADHGEHTNDHQFELGRAAEKQGFGEVVWDITPPSLARALNSLKKRTAPVPMQSHFIPVLTRIAREEGVTIPPARTKEKYAKPASASITVATLNGGEPLIKAIRGMLQQDFKGDYEVIVVDDGSFDGKTPALLKKNFGNHEKVKLIFLPRSGVCKARNAAIRAAQYEVIINMDHDDNPEPDWLRIMVNGFDSPDVGAVSAYGHYGGTSTGFRKDLLQHLNGYDEDFFYYREDTDLSFRIMELGYKYQKVNGAKWHGDRTLVTPKGIWKLLTYTHQRFMYHMNDVLLHKKHRTPLCDEFLHVKGRVFVDPVQDFKVATGLWEDSSKEPTLSSPRGMTFFARPGFLPFALIVGVGVGYVIGIKMARLAGSFKHGHLLM